MTAWSQSNDCTPFYEFREGLSWEMGVFDKKDKLVNKLDYLIYKVDLNNVPQTAWVSAKVFDDDDEMQYELDFKVSCSDGVFTVDLSNTLNPSVTQSFREMEMEVSGSPLTIPASLEKGQKLEDAMTNIKVMSAGIQIMSSDITMRDRVVTGRETITVPAGSYECFVINSTQSIKAGFINKDYRIVEYYHEGIGLIRSETYNKKDKLDSYTVLLARKN